MKPNTRRTFGSDFKQFFIRGLVVLLPTVLTLWIVVKAYQFIDSAIAEPINHSVRLTIAKVTPHWEVLRQSFEPAEDVVEQRYQSRALEGSRVTKDQVRAELRTVNIQQWWAERWYMNLIGLVIAIVAVYTAGRLLGGYFGRRIYRRLEGLITTLPVFKQVYPHIKQIVNFFFGEEKRMKFSQVVMVEYPRSGVWSIAFQTGAAMTSIAKTTGDDSINLFIPHSPTPFTGYAVTVARSEVVELPITVEEAIRFIVSGGVLMPDHQLTAETQTLTGAVVIDAAAESLRIANAGGESIHRVPASTPRQPISK